MSRPRSRPIPLLAAGVALAVALGGCGAGTRASTAPGSRTRSQSSPTTITTPAGSTTTNGSVTTTATAALPGTGRPVVTIGDKNYTEQFVLGQLYLQALKAQGFRVNITQNIGPPAVVRNSLGNGSLAMYPEYLDDFDQSIARLHRGFHTARAAERAGESWARRHGLRLLVATPFSDTTAVAVTDAYAAAHRLRTIHGLSQVAATLVIGGAAPFATTRVGLPALSSVYGVTPAMFRPIAVGSQYTDLDENTIQAAFVNTTDGQLASGDYRVLGDPRRVFGFGNVVPVASARMLATEGPAFAQTIDRVDRTLTLTAIRQLNNAADATSATGETPASIALQFLQTHGLLTPLTGATSVP